MANSKKQQQDSINNNDNNDDVSKFIDYNDDDIEDDLEVTSSRRDNSNGGGLTRSIAIGDRLSERIVEETSLLEWIQALDLQYVGACRADEMLKPLLKVNNTSGFGAQHCLLSHLNQHFQASEVGLLARCLCVPLVSMRVGKVEKRGSMLCPTSVRLKLEDRQNLMMRNFLETGVKDDRCISNNRIYLIITERLVTLGDASEYSALVVEEIPADQSGRSFLMKLPDGGTFYFWCSEKSKLLGNDLLLKMKDLLKRKPTLAELSGISESRLESFVTHIRSYLVGPSMINVIKGGEHTRSFSTSVMPLCTRRNGSQTMKGHPPYQGSLSPRPSTFKEGLPRNLASLKCTSRDKTRRHGDLYLPVVGSPFTTEAVLNLSEKSQPSNGSTTASPLSFLESLDNCCLPVLASTSTQIPSIGALFSPYYCWCPPCTSPSVASISKLPTSLAEPFSLPPPSTLLPASRTPGMLPQIPPLNLASFPSLEFPALLSDPSTQVSYTKQSSQLPTFTPLLCDPIVHIPIAEFCSSGQSYVVSARPGIATSIPSLHPKLMGTMIPESESMMDKGARETLRLLIGGSSGQSSTSLMGVFPTVLNDEDRRGVVVTGSRGLYSGMSDVHAIVNSFAAVGLASVSETSTKGVSVKNCYNIDATDALEHTSSNLDLQDSGFTARDEEID